MTQSKAVIDTIEKLGGIATLSQINQNIFSIKDCEWKTKTPFASIRRIVRHTNGIFCIKNGVYALEDFRMALAQKGIVEQTDNNKDSEEVRIFNHAYYQGVLLEMGKLRKLATFVPQQDKGRMFLNQGTLGELRTLQDIPQYGYPEIVQRSSTIDVIWFNEHKMPDSFFEIEHSTDIQNSLLKFNDLRDFSARMVIVAYEKRHREYNKKLEYDAFRMLRERNRVHFLSYESLDIQYEQEIQKQKFEFVL